MVMEEDGKVKKCSRCQITKTTKNFYKNKAKKDGLTTECIDCIKIYKNKYYKFNKESVDIKNKINYQLKIEERRNYHKNYRIKNKELVSKRKKESYIKNKEYYSTTNKIYYELNKKEHKEKSRIYQNNKKKKDIKFRLICNLRNRIYYAIKAKGIEKKTAKDKRYIRM